jgi:hypothetical protein
MKTQISSLGGVLAFTLFLTLPGCLSDEILPPFDDEEPVTTGLNRYGSGRVAPADRPVRSEREMPRLSPGQVRYPELPREKIDRLRRLMSEEELLELLGPPLRKEIIVQSIDGVDRDWNAWVWTWRFQDPEFSQYALVRDLEIRLARAEERDRNLGRVEVPGAGWYLEDWELY